ncbi:MAG TPA: autotransporter-associated beta strand repeat-containing protein [Verrucomicrobiae bacterium]|jgi:autotransporter-associated beta strand protein|nr:autotransporter-associated beta strand repeat-containing protein [Verrucomicrobiae bacterium]
MKTENPHLKSKSGQLLSPKPLLAAIGLAVAGATASAQTLWIGATGDYNNPASWNGTYNGSSNPNTSDDNGSNNVVLILPGDPVWQHGDTLAGNGAGTSGAYRQTGSTNNTGGGNWLRMGIGSGSYGSYILSNGVVNVGGRTQIGENGVGYLEIDGGTYNGNVNDGGANPGMVCGQGDAGPGTGTLVINNGTVNYSRETWIGEQGGSRGVGYFFMNGGTLNLNDWVAFGRNGGGGGAQGFGVMTGGTINFHGGGQFLIGGGGVGSLAQSGGTLNAFNQYLVPQGDGGGGGTGTNTLSGSAVLNVHDWLAVGRGNGYGELNISGNAAITRDNASDGGSHFDIGAGGVGVVNQSGGSITESSSDLWLGESSSGIWNLNSGTAHVQKVVMCVNNSASATLNLNGGILQTIGMSSPSTGFTVSLLNLNGGTLQGAANNAAFITGLFQAAIGANGVTLDSQGFNLTIPQALADNGGGSLTKIGSGMLTLSGANTYAGATAVNAGILATTTASTGGGAYTVANGATLNVQVVGSVGSQLNVSSLAFTGATATLGIDLNSFGNPSVAPINVSGALSAAGTVTINLADGTPQVGQFPLISYGSSSGANYHLGPLPLGVTANLVDNASGHSIDLDITDVNLPRWDGNAGGVWDIGLTTNWINIGTGLATFYRQGNAVAFDDSATGTTTVNLAAAVTPANVTINNNSLSYTLTGSGSINGSVGILKEGANTFAIENVNGYTGPTVIANGTLAVGNLANGGSPSAIGSSSANATNLVLSGGDLAYTGSAVAINRGYSTTSSNSAITTTANLTLSGTVTAADGGALTKFGPAQLAYTGAGVNALSGADSPGFVVEDGSVLIDGSSGIQTNFIAGARLGVDGISELATVTLTNTTVNVSGNIDVANLPSANGALVIGSNTTVNVGSWFILGDGNGSTASVTMNDGVVNVPNGRLFLCSSPGSTATFTMNGGTINKAGDYFAIVNGGWNGVGARTGVVNQNNGTINCQSECWVGDSGGAGNGSVGTYNLKGGTLTLGSWFGVGRDGSTGFFNMTGGTLNKAAGGDMVIGRGGSSGTFTMSGGTINRDAGNPIIIGQGQGVGEFDMSGGSLTSGSEYWLGVDNGTVATNNISGTAQINNHNWVTIGRNGLGVVNMSSGQFSSDTQPFIVGIWAGSQGIWNQSGGSLNVNQDIWIGQGDPNAHGVINLSGGAITNTGWLSIGREAGQGVLNISGGIMVKAGVGNNISIGHNSGASGQVTISGTGTFLCLSGETWVGENAAPGSWTMNGGTAVLGVVRLAENADATGVMALNGGSLTAAEITTGNTGASQRELDFNGGTLVAAADNANFIHDLSAANVLSGGAVVDTAGHSVSINQALVSSGSDGGLLKKGNGALYLNGVNTYTNVTQVTAGALGGSGTIAGPVNVAAGAQLTPGAGSVGTLTINNALNLAAGSTTTFKLSLDGGPSSDAVTGLTSVNYGGALVVRNVGSGPLVAGAQFHLFNAAAHTGGFSSVTVLPAGAGTFNPATGVLTLSAGSGVAFNPVQLSNGNLILAGTGGTPNGGYTLLTSTNIAQPVSTWATNTSGTLDGSGAFSNGIPVGTAPGAHFFILRTP